jgi:membrane protein
VDAIDIARDVKTRIREDNVVVASAGVAFFGMLSIVPALVALVSIYGLVADPDDVRTQIDDLLESAPTEVRDFFSSQLADLAGGSNGGLGLSAAVGIVIALWGASGAVKHLMAALNTVEDVHETRGMLALRAISLAFIVGAVVVIGLAIGLMAVLPALLASSGLGTWGRVVVGIVRFPLLGLVMVLSLAVLYRYGPNRPPPGRFRPFPAGALVAAAMWIVLTALFSVYTASVGRLNQTYAATGGLVVLLLWLLLTVFCIMVGAEVEAVRRRRHEVAPGHPLEADVAPSVSPTVATAALFGLLAGAALRRR